MNYVNDWGFTPCGERVLAADITCQNHRVSVEIIVMTKNMHTLTVIDGNGNKIYDGNPIPMEIQHTKWCSTAYVLSGRAYEVKSAE